MAESGVESTAVPIKVPEPQDHAPPTLAEPASGPVAEMSGALSEEKKEGVPTTTNESNVADAKSSSINGTTESAPESTANKSDDPTQQATTQDSAVTEDTEMKDAPESAPTEDQAAPETNGTPAEKKAPNGKRKSVGGVPEHKGKKLNKKKSVSKITHLDTNPGDLFFARLKSYPPWPSIICDEEMLPQSLLDTRPVTTKKEDGTYNEPYADGGKKVMDRTYPIMFLHTNEFAWIPNTDLVPLQPEECKAVPPQKKTKALIAAYEVAAEGHDLQHFKSVLADHARAIEEDEEARKAAVAEKAAKAEGKKKRKSEVKPADDDVDMADADAEAPAKKASKKRKKETDSDDEETEKTPKTTKLKLTTKTPTTEKKAKEPKSAKPKSEKKSKKGASEPERVEEEKEEEPLDPVEARKAREKEVLFLRHKLQKGFLSRDQAPREDEMPQMSNYIKKLEVYADLEVAIIRATKINKVLKALVKLNTIPRDEEFQFRKRSVELLGKWNKILGTEAEPADKDKASPPTNGVHDEKDKAEEKSDDASEEKKDDVEEPEDKVAEPAEAIEKVSAEVSADAGAKASVIDSLEKEADTDTDMKDTVPASKTEAAPAIERVPESAAAAHEAQNVVRTSE